MSSPSVKTETTSSGFKYLFGPVPSRRFGRSLGVDLVPLKTCPLNCVFCEVGPTTCLTTARKEYVPEKAVRQELLQWRRGGGTADFVTVTGSGEPTLHAAFGNVLQFIKEEIKIRSALLTNSTLLHLPEVRRAAALADVIKVTLSAWDENSFRAITRPHAAVRFASIIDGLGLLRREYPSAIWMEVFIVPGLNDGREQVKAIAALARAIQPDRIQLNTAVRPTAASRVGVVAPAFLRELSVLFEPRAEVIAHFAGNDSGGQCAGQNVILAMLKRRPCTAGDVAAAFSMKLPEVQAILREMETKNLVRIERRQGDEYYIGRE